MRSCGKGYAGLDKFTALMNIPKPMTRRNYYKTVNTVMAVVKSVTYETMLDAGNEVMEKYPFSVDDNIYDTSVACLVTVAGGGGFIHLSMVL